MDMSSHHTVTFLDRDYSVAVPRLLNTPPGKLQDAVSVTSFKSLLKNVSIDKHILHDLDFITYRLSYRLVTFIILQFLPISIFTL